MRYLICPTCPALNRVPVERLDQGPRCGKCKGALAVDPVLSADARTLEMAVRSASGPVVVDFWAPWCGPCRTFAPVFASHALAHQGQALYLKVDTEAHPDAGQRYGIRAIPTLVVFQGGREVARQSGAADPAQLRAWLAPHGS